MKRIIIFLSLILSIILFSITTLYISKKQTVAFPHYKQAVMKLNGSAIATVGRDFTIPIVMVDENPMSEMASNENIKEVLLFNKNDTLLKINKWEIETGVKDKTFLMRKLNLEVRFDKEGVYYPNKIKIVFQDDKVKEYKLGDFKVQAYSETYIEKNMATNAIDYLIIPADNNMNGPVAGIQVVMDTEKKPTVIKEIELGISGLGIDKEHIYSDFIVDDPNVIWNLVNTAKEQNIKWTEYLNAMTINEKANQSTKVNIRFNEKTDKKATIIFPLIRAKDKKFKNTILCFNLKLTITKENKNYELTLPQPMLYLPLIHKDFEPDIFLMEEGI